MSFETNKLEDVATIIDSLHKTPKYAEVGRPMVRCTDVAYGKLDLKRTFKVDDEVFSEFSRRYSPELNDIIITRVGSYGISALVVDTDFCLGQNTSAIVAREIEPRYLYLALNSKFVRNQIEYSVVGSTQKTLSLKAIGNLAIPRFAPEEEKLIAKVGGDLDNKIEHNQQTNQTLEQIAQAIFKSWFVDFEPTRAKIAARKNGEDPERAAMAAISGKSIEALAQLDEEQLEKLSETAALFPDALVDSELGEVPAGWGISDLKSVTTKIGSGATPRGGKSSYKENGISQVRSMNVFDGNFSFKELAKIDEEQAERLRNVIVEEKDVLINITGASVTRCCIIPPSVLPARVNQHVCIIRADKKSVNEYYIYQALVSPSGKGILNSLANAGATREALTKAHIENFEVLLPSELLMSTFQEKVSNLVDLQFRLAEEVKTLGLARDTLLPKLLSGELPTNAS